MFGDSVTVADTLLISGFSILIVFLVLLLLSFMIDFCAWLLRQRETKQEAEQRAETVKTGNGNSAAGVPFSQEPGAGTAAGNNSDAVLVAAAVAAYMAADPDEIVVRRITRVEDCDSAWARNARQESIR